MASESNRCALLIIDVFSHFRFDGGRTLAAALVAVAPTIADTAMQCRREGIAVIYCNDNFNRWTDSWRDIVAYTAKEGLAPAGTVTRLLQPAEQDVVLLKSRHSAFVHTQLTALLTHLAVRRVGVVGISADACVSCTAIDAYVRGLDVTVMDDCVAAITEERKRRALTQLQESMGIHICAGAAWVQRCAEP